MKKYLLIGIEIVLLILLHCGGKYVSVTGVLKDEYGIGGSWSIMNSMDHWFILILPLLCLIVNTWFLWRSKKGIRKEIYTIYLVIAFCVIAMGAWRVVSVEKEIKEKNFAYDIIPIEKGDLAWGMSEEEVRGILGEPDEIETLEYGKLFIYEKPVETVLGSSVKTSLYLGLESLQREDPYSKGLGRIEITIPDTTKEKVLEKLTEQYGNISEGGMTPMGSDLSKGIEGFFQETHYSNAWRINKLPKEEQEELFSIYQEKTDGRPIDADTMLVYLTISGTAASDSYECRIEWDAEVLNCMQYFHE